MPVLRSPRAATARRDLLAHPFVHLGLDPADRAGGTEIGCGKRPSRAAHGSCSTTGPSGPAPPVAVESALPRALDPTAASRRLRIEMSPAVLNLVPLNSGQIRGLQSRRDRGLILRAVGRRVRPAQELDERVAGLRAHGPQERPRHVAHHRPPVAGFAPPRRTAERRSLLSCPCSPAGSVIVTPAR